MQRVVVTGANGQLGRALSAFLPEAIFLTRNELDLTDSNVNIIAKVEKLKPKVLINCAAYTKVDQAELEPKLAMKVNRDAVGSIAIGCAIVKSRLIHLSTDYVFDGNLYWGPQNENSTIHPKSVYAQTKDAGETHALLNQNATVIRTSWLFGEGNNFVKTMLKLSESGEPISVVNDQVGRPTYAPDLAECLVKLMWLPELPSVLHIQNEGEPVSWFDFAQEIFVEAKRKVTLLPVTTTQYRERILAQNKPYANRPSNSVFSLDLLHQLKLSLRPWKEALGEYLKTAI